MQIRKFVRLILYSSWSRRWSRKGWTLGRSLIFASRSDVVCTFLVLSALLNLTLQNKWPTEGRVRLFIVQLYHLELRWKPTVIHPMLSNNSSFQYAKATPRTMPGCESLRIGMLPSESHAPTCSSVRSASSRELKRVVAIQYSMTVE